MIGRGAFEIVGRLVLADRVTPARLAIAADRISQVTPDEAGLDGPLIAPGSIDVHVHGWGGHDAMGGPDALDGMARALARRGVTSFLPTAVAASIADLHRFASEVRDWSAEAPADGTAPLGFNLEGPFLAPARAGAHKLTLLLDPADVGDGDIEPLIDGLRIITIAPERPGAIALIRSLSGRGVRVSLGHSAATLDEAREGYAAGAVSTTHLFNAMSGLAHRAPGLAVAALLDDAVWTEVIADGQHVHPEMWSLVARCKPADRWLLVSDAIAPGGTSLRRARLGGLDVEIADGRATLAGSAALAGSVVALSDAVRNVARAGIPLPAAVAAASAVPAGLLGLTDRGSIAVGQRADLVALDDDLRVRRVWLAGREIDLG